MNRYKSSGFTLVEVLLALSLVSLLGSGLFLLYWVILTVGEKQSASCDAHHYARTAMQWITRDIISSYPPEGDSSLNTDQLILHLAVEGKEAEEIRYFLYSNNLRRNNLALVQNISYLNFQRSLDSDLITVTVESSVNDEIYRLTAAARPRITATPQ
ncbi:MAG: prepilin-type N-terminal cleavage/methylation domain-containing protein [Syntrophomonas sp.]|uniref:prepilin-type N-terminal cleavage/methylation domain-containing protein n=1 Tax=Syntrophomonas sp. TaxID=2053627 RepID=UPI0026287884|nr:prepilin-type N-terminal cleavage/methylation domain-containing protein [Syntrophomonas sp.]MDD2510226.1 prepilin-type N-terminal cleavage/methylation domain-containing protein [Syntrophomonas sp.]MDD3879975.1 prepilin-type N-terminal cleavage/methylation domain-containing protein [Syntrophomonas sp.]MDD4627165.1 prepilin-type N-terminal cleavage/methylation domain-containing protein [Syntrophomonas sp.]